MKSNLVVGTLASGTLLYLTIAACSAGSEALRSPAGDGGGTGPGASASSSGSVLDPVPPASAADPAPRVPTSSTEPCDKTYQYGATTYRYAEHAYPGATKADLASVQVLVTYASTNAPPSYDTVVTAPFFVKDGGVAYLCGTEANYVREVTFVRP